MAIRAAWCPPKKDTSATLDHRERESLRKELGADNVSEQPSNDDKQSVTACYSEWSTPLQRSFSPWVTLGSRVEQEKLQHTHKSQKDTQHSGVPVLCGLLGDDKEGTGHNSMSPRACLCRASSSYFSSCSWNENELIVFWAASWLLCEQKHVFPKFLETEHPSRNLPLMGELGDIAAGRNPMVPGWHRLAG